MHKEDFSRVAPLKAGAEGQDLPRSDNEVEVTAATLLEKCPTCWRKPADEGWDSHRGVCSACSYEIYRNTYGGM